MVKKILSLWLLYARMDLLWFLKDFKMFAAYAVTDVVINTASIAGIWLIAVRFAGIGGMDVYQILFMLGYSLTAGGVTYAFFSYNIYEISRIIGRGQMDHILIMPQPVWLTLLTHGFVPISAAVTLITGIGITLFSLSNIGTPINTIFILAFMTCIGLSVIVGLSYSFLWGSLAFYSPVAAEEICTSVWNLFYSLRSFPLNGVGVVGRVVMLSVIPVGLFAWFPSTALLGVSSRLNLAIFAAISVTFLGLAILIFRKGLQHYVKNGSNRYSDRGHRR